MTLRDADLVDLANSRSDSKVGVRDSLVGRSEEFRSLFKRIWPRKTAAHLAIAADVTVRQAERYMSGDQPFGGDVIFRLLRSDAGGDLLEIIMKGVNPDWWRATFHERRIAAARRRRKEAERELRELEEDA